jgi:hypothetical protein
MLTHPGQLVTREELRSGFGGPTPLSTPITSQGDQQVAPGTVTHPRVRVCRDYPAPRLQGEFALAKASARAKSVAVLP